MKMEILLPTNPILRLAEPTRSARQKGARRKIPQPEGPGRPAQSERYNGTFGRLSKAFDADEPLTYLSEDPSGIAPERALVFVTAGQIKDVLKAFEQIGLDFYLETELEPVTELPAGFSPAGSSTSLPRNLYATAPTLASLRQILTQWNLYESGVKPVVGFTPLWNLFDLLIEVRCWGPADRFSDSSRAIIEDRLPEDNSEVFIEFEIWPNSNAEKRKTWKAETETAITSCGGRVVHRASIAEQGFVYEAVLASLPADAVRSMLDDSEGPDSILTIEGVQYIQPHTRAQTLPAPAEDETAGASSSRFDEDAPLRVALLDGTPVAGHKNLSGGVDVADLHDLERLSTVDMRFHATSMASLILNGDLVADNNPLQDTRLISVPILQDSDAGSYNSNDRLFIDTVHVSLTQLIEGVEPIAPMVFVVNFSIGISETRFTGYMSTLARLLDWWSFKKGLLFVISAGNVSESVTVKGCTSADFEDSAAGTQIDLAWHSLRLRAFERTLFSPAEAINALTVGALSSDSDVPAPAPRAGAIGLKEEGRVMPQLSSAVGLGWRSGIKPDLLHLGGHQEVRVFPSNGESAISPYVPTARTGIHTASPRNGGTAVCRTQGTSVATALTTRSILLSAEKLVTDEGPYSGLELPRKQAALLTRALAVHSSHWPQEAHTQYSKMKNHLGSHRHLQAKEDTCRYFGHGALNVDRMLHSPENGATLIGYASIKKDGAQIFRVPLPSCLSGERVPRTMDITLAWFSPVSNRRVQYRLAGLEALIETEDGEHDKTWGLRMKSGWLDSNLNSRGTVWSRRLVNETATVPNYDDEAELVVRVQCMDKSGGGLNPDDDIEFAIVVSLVVESELEFDIHTEIEDRLRIKV